MSQLSSADSARLDALRAKKSWSAADKEFVLGLIDAAVAGNASVDVLEELREVVAEMWRALGSGAVLPPEPQPEPTPTPSEPAQGAPAHGPVELLATSATSLRPGDTLSVALHAWHPGESEPRPVPATFTATGGTITPGGTYTAGNVAGNYTISAHSAALPWRTAEVPVSIILLTGAGSAAPSTPPSGPPPDFEGIPGPQEGDTVLIDWTASGAHSIQESSIDTFSEANSVGDPYGTGAEVGGTFAFTTDVDGAGTHAIRCDYTAVGESWGDDNRNLILRLFATRTTPPVSYPTELYVQYRHHMGRTATGGGNGSIGAFEPFNDADPGGNAGCKRMLLGRQREDGSGRIDYTWSGPSPGSVGVSCVHSGNGFDQGMVMNVSSVNVGEFIGQTHVFTIYVRAASSLHAEDGIIRTWHNDVLTSEHTAKKIGHEGISGIAFPTVFRSPALDMTEYFWDLRAWTPLEPD